MIACPRCEKRWPMANGQAFGYSAPRTITELIAEAIERDSVRGAVPRK